MRRLHAAAIVAWAATGLAFAAGCGGDSDGDTRTGEGGTAGESSSIDGGGFTDGGTSGEGGTDGGVPPVNENVYIVGDGEPPTCPGVDPYQSAHCGWQITLPSGVDFGTQVDGGGVAGGGGGPAGVCEIPVVFEVPDPSVCLLTVDCEHILYYGPNTQVTEWWEFDDSDSPTAIVLSDALCIRLVQDGFERIDLTVGECPSVLP